MALTQDQIDDFRSQGYLRIGPLLTEDEIQSYRREYDRLFAEADETGRYRDLAGGDHLDQSVDTADHGANPTYRMLQIINMGERSVLFSRLNYDERILDLVEDLLGPNLMLFHDQALFKPACHGGPVYWHQDNAYWKCRPANLLSCWLTLDDVCRENGAMQVIPGSHLHPVWHDPAQTTDALLETRVDDTEAMVVDLPAGGIMLHHCQTLHYTQPNTTDVQRRAYAIHFMTPGTRDGEGNVIPVGFSHPMLRARF